MKGYMNLSRGIGLATCLTFFFSACSSDKETNIPDVSDIHVEIEITRFENLLLADSLPDAARLQTLMHEHPAFSNIYFQHVMPGADDIIDPGDDEARIQHIQNWIRHPRTRWLYDTVSLMFPNLDFLEKDLEKAFAYGQYYFPGKAAPRIYTTISDFGYFPFIYAEDSLRDGIGISLEMFLGDTFPYRKYTGLNNAFSDYLVRSYNKDHIVKRTLEVWVDDMAGPPPGNRLLDLMIHNGKKLFILKSLMPAVHDSVIMDYPSNKLEWVLSNEKNIWYHFMKKDLLYSTSIREIQKLIGPSPGSPGMPPEAPGNTGSWLGWQIVKTYMQNHPETTFQQLLAISDAQSILDQSGYRPPR